MGSQRGVELDEKTSLLSSDHYNAAHRMQVSPEKTPITAMSMDEVLERAAQLAEEAKAPARQESSVSQPTSCTDSDDMKEVRAAIQAGNAQHLLELCKQDPYRLRHRDMVRGLPWTRGVPCERCGVTFACPSMCRCSGERHCTPLQQPEKSIVFSFC
mgnify:CR=1 FL=1